MRLSAVLRLSAFALCGAFALGCPIRSIAQNAATVEQQKLDLVYRYLNTLYVDEVDPAPLAEGAIRGMIAELDPHSAYLSADEMKGVQESFEGEFSGIGVEFNVLQDTVIVVNTIAGGPAERVGVLPNDRIVRIDTVRAVGFKQVDVPKYLRGKTGSKVDIEVVRHGEPGTLQFTIVRDKIPINTVDAVYKIDDHTGYIKVNRFGRTTMDEFYKAFDKLGKIDGLLLDLRGNGGGLLDQAIEMTNFFLPKGALILATEGRAMPSSTFQALYDGDFKTGRLVVLIDESSASASEIVAGAIQDWDRGVVVGRPSFGKGLVQRQVALPDGSAVRITVSRYHTPSGRIIQRPYEKGKRSEYYLDHLRRYGSDADSLHTGEPLFRTLRTGRTVYGGGGITPDVIVPIDTTGVTPWYVSLVRRGVLNEYAVKYLDAERKKLSKTYPSVEDFTDRFEVSDEMLDALAAMGVERGIPLVSTDYAMSKPLLRMQLKALTAQKLHGTEAFYRIINDTDSKAFRRASELLEAWQTEAIPLLESEK